MEALLPPGTIGVDNDDNQLLEQRAINHTTSFVYDEVPTPNYNAIAAASVSSGLSTTAATCLPPSWSSFAHTAATTGNGVPPMATPNQQATPQQTSQWTATLTGIGHSLSGHPILWLDFAILSMEGLLDMLRTIRVAAGCDPATNCSDASAAAAAALEG